jgi:AcrR family transcriptional regulator
MVWTMPRAYPSAKGKILEAATRVILRDGPRGLSIDAVLQESGVSKGGFFHHFPTKEALLSALLAQLASIARATANERLPETADRRGRSLRGQIALVVSGSPKERENMRALVLALLTAVMDSASVAQRASATNEEALSLAKQEGVGVGVALVIQMALDGFALGEALGTLRVTPKRRSEFQAVLSSLLEPPQRRNEPS